MWSIFVKQNLLVISSSRLILAFRRIIDEIGVSFNLFMG